MRVELPKQSTDSVKEKPVTQAVGGSVPLGTPPSAVPAEPKGEKPRRRRKRGEKILRAVTRWQSVLPLVLVCAGALGWSLLVRLPNKGGAMTVQARADNQIPPRQPVVTAEALADLRLQAAQASVALVQQPDEIGPLLYELERGARQLGWRVELSLDPALSKPGGVPDVRLHPVRVRLEEDGDQSAPPYTRLLSWLRLVSSLPKRMEVGALRLRSAGAGLAKAEVDLRLFSLITHDKSAEK